MLRFLHCLRNSAPPFRTEAVLAMAWMPRPDGSMMRHCGERQSHPKRNRHRSPKPLSSVSAWQSAFSNHTALAVTFGCVSRDAFTGAVSGFRGAARVALGKRAVGNLTSLPGPELANRPKKPKKPKPGKNRAPGKSTKKRTLMRSRRGKVVALTVTMRPQRLWRGGRT